ncbi:GtrA family protein [Roseibium sp. HPY-6]|uniref:GtrA family protein n=1 Tax=Roseibium sp. HPY-6 TaxID=3229852 RepID=UPI00338D68F3
MTLDTIITTTRQMVRYGVVGALTNLLGYLIYLLVTWLWLEPKVAVAIMYPIAALTAYFGHAKYTFEYNGYQTRGLFRYCVSHAIGYATSLGMLFVFFDLLGYPHQLVQAASIFVVAGLLFLLFRFYVFREVSKS